MRRVTALGSLLLLTALALPAAASAADRYIVVLKDGVARPGAVADDHRQRFEAKPTHVYSHALKGYAATIPAQRVDDVRAESRVAFVERDRRVEAFAQELPTGVDRIFADENAAIDIDGTDDYRVDVDVAIIDTGIDYDHPDLQVVSGTNCTGGGPFKQSCSGTAPADGNDDNGHGTHVAGTAAAIDNGAGVVGVAPGARLHAVKVLDSTGSGWTSWIVAGIDYVTANAATIEVANMSLGGGSSDIDSCDTSDAETVAICNSVEKGVVYAVAAGNEDSNANGSAPATHPDVITTSALADFDGEAGGLGSPTCRSDLDDTLADFSNWGDEIEVAAPGVCILSTVPGGGYDGSYSGTSMASPHVAGAAALLASRNNPNDRAGVYGIRDTIVAKGNSLWTDDSADGIKEPLLDVGDATVFAPVLIPGSGDGGDGGETEDPGTVSWDLSARVYKVKGVQHVDLAWATGAADSTDTIAIYRDGVNVKDSTNDGKETDNIGKKGGGSYSYHVCEKGTTNCSNTVTVTF